MSDMQKLLDQGHRLLALVDAKAGRLLGAGMRLSLPRELGDAVLAVEMVQQFHQLPAGRRSSAKLPRERETALELLETLRHHVREEFPDDRRRRLEYGLDRSIEEIAELELPELIVELLRACHMARRDVDHLARKKLRDEIITDLEFVCEELLVHQAEALRDDSSRSSETWEAWEEAALADAAERLSSLQKELDELIESIS